ncbi:hypothetical protein BFP77_06390 [Maribacter sp. 4U21]|nr:hypothetical protein BFP77_06390 [Maribacter sp. 4U21]
MKGKQAIFILFLHATIVSCNKKEVAKTYISFYHWKSEANFTESYKKAIDPLKRESKRVP